jgi:hypothetical protein
MKKFIPNLSIPKFPRQNMTAWCKKKFLNLNDKCPSTDNYIEKGDRIMKVTLILSVIFGMFQMATASAEDCQVNLYVKGLPATIIGIKPNLTGPISGSGGQGSQCRAYAESIELAAIKALDCQKLGLKVGDYTGNTSYHFKNNIMGGMVNQSQTFVLQCQSKVLITSYVGKVAANKVAISAVPNAAK